MKSLRRAFRWVPPPSLGNHWLMMAFRCKWITYTSAWSSPCRHNEALSHFSPQNRFVFLPPRESIGHDGRGRGAISRVPSRPLVTPRPTKTSAVVFFLSTHIFLLTCLKPLNSQCLSDGAFINKVIDELSDDLKRSLQITFVVHSQTLSLKSSETNQPVRCGWYRTNTSGVQLKHLVYGM